MSAPPIPCRLYEGRFIPLQRAQNIVGAHFAEGEVYMLVEQQDRSQASHNHYFAALTEMWESLPDREAERFPTLDAFRSYCLIKGGFCTVEEVPCFSGAEARRWAAFLRRDDPYALVDVTGASVRRYRAESQSMKAMGKERFQASKDAVLEIAAGMLGLSPSTGSSETGGAKNPVRAAA